MLRRRIARVLVATALLLCAAAGVAHGSVSGVPRVAIDSREQSRAERVVLGPKDFPAGWLPGSGLPDLEPTEAGGPICTGFTPDLSAATVRGLASYSTRWVKGRVGLARAIVSVFADVRQAKLVFDRSARPYIRRCLAPGSTEDGNRWGSGAPLPLGPVGGDQVVAYRARGTDVGSSTEWVHDFVYVRKGRTFAVVIFSAAPTPTQVGLERTVVRRLTSRMP